MGDERLPGVVREKTKFPELRATDGTQQRKAFARYVCDLVDRPGENALVDEEQLQRERKTFTKQRLRSFLKNSVNREAWAGAPWLVKSKLASDYRINTVIPEYLTHAFQSKQRKNSNSYGRKGEYQGPILNFYGPQHGLPILKPKGNKSKHAQDEARIQHERWAQYHHPPGGSPDFNHIGHQGQPVPMNHYYQGPPQPDYPMVNGYKPIAAKGQPKPTAPPPPKYPIEDLEIPPSREVVRRPSMKFLSQDTPSIDRKSEGAGNGIDMKSVGPLLETWDTLNVYCEVFQLDSFTFDDYVEALRFTSDEIQCELLVEVHCAVLKRLVNDVNDKNGQVQVTLPYQIESEQETPQENSIQATPTPEPEAKPPARSTRSSLVKSDPNNMTAADQNLLVDAKMHRAAEIDRSIKGYDWKARLRKRDFTDGKWIVIVVGLLNQLSGDPRLLPPCSEILKHLAPMDMESTPEVAISQYQSLDVNLRVRILQILCMKSLETKLIRQYMEDCSAQMTEHRKEKNAVKRQQKAA